MSIHACSIAVLSLQVILAAAVSADIRTNSISSFTAPDGSRAYYAGMFDTVSSNYLSGTLSIVDRNEKILVDSIQPEDLSKYWIAGFTGKRLLLASHEDVISNQLRVIIYKVSRKGLGKIGEQTIDYAVLPRLTKSIIRVNMYKDGLYGMAAYDTKLKKHLFSMPYVSNSVSYISEKGTTAHEQKSSGAVTVTYYKRGSLLSTHNLPAPVDGRYRVQFDSKGGLLYWLETGPNPFPTNSPVTYISVKGKRKPDYSTLDDAPYYWHCANWNGRYLYIYDQNTKTLSVYILKNKAVKIGSIVSPHYERSIYDKSRVYVFTAAPGGQGIVEYNRKLTKIQWFEPAGDGKLSYLGNGVFKQTTEEYYPLSHITKTIRIFNKHKTIATHVYDEPL